MKIVFLDTKTLGKDISLDEFKNFGEVIIYETTAHNQTLTRVQDADIVITNKVVIDSEIMKKSNIKLICVTATGTNNIDLEYARESGIEVKNVAGYSTNSVAQLTITLVLTFAEKLDYYRKYVETKQWEKSNLFTHIDVPFFELKDKNWGIIGLGEIGKKVAKIAENFECNVNYYSTSGKNSNTQYNQISLNELLETSDIVTIHSPLNDTTYNLINKTNLNLLKDNAILVNVGRGGIINEYDLANIINEGKKLFCGLDVLEKEPIEENSPLNRVRNKDQLIITPHIGWGSVESRKKLINCVLDNVQKFVV
ncbi:hydroxyacid dehydrogenase [Halarcobacter ebronensis]|uniref:Hydroxyacid dehydrogenase n=1 Tax=Halarcobacter ebronensis TaxID=1462615 RepID=A0A4Q0YDS2_9BACT|nr:D-2-hydroxyacid dehydrogenase [Halarcobacter ebronensis]RXJ68622.1 hydroxyacid dehydrogenase [Halarcobacter ebronensis]